MTKNKNDFPIGSKHGDWKVIDKTSSKLKCRCECGNIKTLYKDDLQYDADTRHYIRRCANCLKKKGRANKKIELVGKTLGSWTILEPATEGTAVGYESDRLVHKCRCKCGVVKYVIKISLLTGCSTKCRSCSNRERAGKTASTKNLSSKRRFSITQQRYLHDFTDK